MRSRTFQNQIVNIWISIPKWGIGFRPKCILAEIRHLYVFEVYIVTVNNELNPFDSISCNLKVLLRLGLLVSVNF